MADAFRAQLRGWLVTGQCRALNGLERCRKPASPPPAEARPTAPVMTLDAQGRIAMADEDRSAPVSYTHLTLPTSDLV